MFFFLFNLYSELLRRSAEQTLMDMVQLLFSRWDNLLNKMIETNE